MYYSYVEIEYLATSFSPARTDLALKLLKYVNGNEDDDDKIKTTLPLTTTGISTTTMATHYAKVNKNSCHNVN
jgi:hypothetical protein